MLSRIMLVRICSLLLLAIPCLPSSTYAQVNPAPAQPATAPKPGADVQALLDTAVALARASKLTDALTGYEAALAKARAAQDRAGEAASHLEIGKLYYNTGASSKALEQWQQALMIFRAIGNKAKEADVLSDLGEGCARTGQPQQALEQFNQALVIVRSTGNKSGEARALSSIAGVYLNTGKPQQALELLQQALTICRTTGDKNGEARALATIGAVYLSTGQPQQALDSLQQALPLFHSDGDKRGETVVLGNIGAVYYRAGESSKALEQWQQALAFSRSTGDKDGEAAFLTNIGLIYKNIGETQKALEQYQQALPIHHAVGNRKNEAATLSNIAHIYDENGQPLVALDQLQQALPIYRAIGDREGEATTLGDIGSAYLSTDHLDRALESLQQALVISRAIGDKFVEANALSNIGNVYYLNDRPKKALEQYQQALPLHRADGDKLNETTTASCIGDAYVLTGELQKALDQYQQVLTACRAAGYKNLEASVLAKTGRVFVLSARPQKALDMYRRAIALLEQIRESIGANPRSRQAYLQSVLDAYFRTLALLVQQNQGREAFALAQKTKARSLLDILASGKVDIDAVLSPEERHQEQELQQQADQLNQAMVKEGVVNEIGAKKRFAALSYQLKQTERKIDTLTDTLNARHPGLADRRVARTATLEDVANFLPNDAALLEYLQVSNEQIALFVVTNHEHKSMVHVVTLPAKAADLARQCAAFHAACADPGKPWKPLSRQMHRLLVRKAEPLLAGKKRLIICPDGPLWDVAFGALTDGTGRLLLSRFTLSMAYSATGAQAAHSTPVLNDRKVAGGLLCFANPDFGNSKRFGDLDGLPGQRPFELPSRPFDLPSRPFDRPSRPFDLPSRPFDRPSRPFDRPSRPFDRPSRQMQVLAERGGIRALPGTQREADVIKKLFPDARIYTGKAAQEDTAKSEMGNYRFLHFATHGFLNDASPLLSSLVLAQPPPGSKEDGFLTAREIFGLKLHAELAVLSACNTGRGEKRSGEGVVGLTWAFFAAGCPTSVVSGWSVDDAATATLMGNFYGGLKAGKGKADALRAAELKLQHDPKHAHPYYWAAFSLIGDGR